MLTGGIRWVRQLSSYFRNQGLRVLNDRLLPIQDDIALPWTIQHLMGTQELIQNLPPEVAQTWWELYEKAAQEVHLGASMRMGMVSVTGRKPSAGVGFFLSSLYDGFIQRISALGRKLFSY